MLPFFANKGYHPRIQVQVTQELLSQSAETFVTNLDRTYMQLKRALTKAQKHYQGLANAQRTTASIFQEGDIAYILAKFIRTTRPSKKLSEHYLGLFPVTESVGSHSYLMNLPEHL